MFKFCVSNSEVKRLIRGNGIRVNDILIKDENLKFDKQNFSTPIKISVGKKKHGLLVFKKK